MSIPSQYVFGDVCTVRESISTPVEMVFMDAPGLETKPGARERCAKHYAALTDPSVPPPGKDRPCIILSSSVPVDSASTTICLKTTLGKTPYEQLPLIVKHFGVKVASKQLPAGEEHVHSDPEWPHPQQLILAIAFTTQRPIKGMWPRGRENGLSDTGKPRGEPDSSNATTPLADDGVPVYKYEREARMWLVDKCDELLMKWTQRCQKDPNFAKVVEADFRVRARSTRNSLGFTDSHCALEHQRCLELAANGSMLSLVSTRIDGWDTRHDLRTVALTTTLPVITELVSQHWKEKHAQVLQAVDSTPEASRSR